MQKHHVDVYRTARYFVIGDDAPEEVWVVAHGYAQRAEAFLQSLQPLLAPGRMIVAPEGLSRFYVNGASGDERTIGASWMTSDDRLEEIDDYVRWLDTAYSDALTRAGTPRPQRLVALGFSQGCATIVRWLARSAMLPSHRCDRLILWGGFLPDEVDLSKNQEWLDDRLVIVAGNRDQFATPARLAAQEERLSNTGIRFRREVFDGGHRMDEDTLRLISVAAPEHR